MAERDGYPPPRAVQRLTTGQPMTDSTPPESSDAYSHARALWVPGPINNPLRARPQAIRLRAKRLEPAIEWYGAVVGAHVTSQTSMGAVLEVGATGQRLELEAVADHDHSATWWAFQFDWLDELLETYLRLKAAGIFPEIAHAHGTGLELVYTDPDGNTVALRYGYDLDAIALFDHTKRVVDVEALVRERSETRADQGF